MIFQTVSSKQFKIISLTVLFLITTCYQDPDITPKLKLTPATIDIQDKSTINMKNIGHQNLDYNIESNVTWIKTISPNNVELKCDTEQELTIELDRTQLKAGLNQTTLRVKHAGEVVSGGEIMVRAFKAAKPSVNLVVDNLAEIKATSVKVSGSVISLGSSNIQAHGYVWSTVTQPSFDDVNDAKKNLGARSTTGAFANTLTGLVPNTTYYIRAYATNSEGTGYSNEVRLKTESPPKTIILSSSRIAEHNSINAVVGQLSVRNAAIGDSYSYSLLLGGTDFNISSNSLRASKRFEYERQNSYAIRVKADDGKGNTFEQNFTIRITDVNDVPTFISLSSSVIQENNVVNALIGQLTTTDADAGDSHTYTLVSGGRDFNIVGNNLRASQVFDYETKNSYLITIRTQDSGGATYEQNFTIRIQDVVGFLIDKTFGGTQNDVAQSIISDGAGGHIIAGGTLSKGAGSSDMWLVKVDGSGNLIWDKTFGGGGIDWAYEVISDGSGGYVLAGATDGTMNREDMSLVKVDGSGNLIWSKTFGGSGFDWAYSIISDGSGGYVLAGITGSKGAGNSDMWLVKVDGSGNLIWDKTFGGSSSDWAYDIISDGSGGYVLAGVTGSKGAGSSDMWLVKVDGSGNLIWDKTFGGSDDEEARSVVSDGAGGYVLAGWTRSKGAGRRDMWLVKVDGSGNLIWDKTFGGSDDEEARSVVSDGAGTYVLAGWTRSKGAGRDDMWLVKVDGSGNLIWDKTFGGSDDEEARSVVSDGAGGYTLAGFTTSKGAGNSDMWLVKYKQD